ncbi:MAG: alpha/beta hydrolase [Solirubrobacteraceae bacterium]
MRRPWRTGVLTLACAALAAAPSAVAASARRAAVSRPAAAAPVQLTDGYGLQVLSQRSLGPRLLELRVRSAMLPAPANMRILLPSGYAKHKHRRYPVLYLFDGTSGHASDWTTRGDAEATTAGLPVIVVMPDIALGGNGGGWCTNWVGPADGSPRWETFHIDQLIPWVDHNLRTDAYRSARAIAGLSQGGFCAMSYAARHPDLFGTAVSYSGADDIAYGAVAQLEVTPIINLTEVVLDGVPANSMFGSRLTNEINWAAHDPATLAPNLAATHLLMYTGNGFPGPFDGGKVNGGANIIENGVHTLTLQFHQRLDSLGIPNYLDDYGNGTHSWPYWTRDLKQSIGTIMHNLTSAPQTTGPVTFTSADSTYSVFGWSVQTQRKVREFSTLLDATAAGFTLQGSGGAVVQTPAVYRPGHRYLVTATGVGPGTSTLQADAGGHLRIPVSLGPSDTLQEYTIDGSTIGTTVRSTQVRVYCACHG